jgi:hypothetical protein
MNVIQETLRQGGDVAAAAGLIYGTAVATTTAVAVFARDPKRRSDARQTLRILLRGTGRRG